MENKNWAGIGVENAIGYFILHWQSLAVLGSSIAKKQPSAMLRVVAEGK
jgi:hypothetical protein